nr:MAG TPA: hypothetical protein [Caudoviricetes sp.]
MRSFYSDKLLGVLFNLFKPPIKLSNLFIVSVKLSNLMSFLSLSFILCSACIAPIKESNLFIVKTMSLFLMLFCLFVSFVLSTA